ncbi:MAG TPA: helix-turn-helix domain-containing protein [Acidimicrobiales bacterium]|nr:helix-turn-helix domain-containing protein [Acidimicrobiales bacterium]
MPTKSPITPRQSPATAIGRTGHAAPAGPDALADALGRVGDRWSLLVVAALLAGPQRFGDLLDGLDGLAPNILSKRLAHLEAEGLVVGEPYSRRPVRHAYRLTASGAELAGVLRLLAHWGATQREGPSLAGEGHAPRHAACGTPLEARWACPTCDEVVDDPATDGLRWI